MKISQDSTLDKSTRILSIPFILLCVAWILPGLLGHDPWKADEPYSFGMVYHIIKTGDWVIPTVAGEPFMEKPPLFYITSALFAKLFSPLFPLHDSARLACAFYMAITFIFTALAARELSGKGAGKVGVLLLMSCVGLQNHAHKLMTDIALLSGFAMAIYGLAVSFRRSAMGGFWTGMGVGIGFMSKGLLAPGILGIISLFLPLWIRELRSRKYALTLAVALLTALPWLLVWPFLLYQKAPNLFREWFWVQNLGRFFSHAHRGPQNKLGFYFYTLPWFAWPAFPLAVWAVWRGWRFKDGSIFRSLPFLTFIVMLFVFTFASSGRGLYALPMLIPLSLLAASSFEGFPPVAARISARTGNALFACLSLALWLGWISLITGFPSFISERLYRFSPSYTPTFVALPFSVALLYTILWISVVVYYDSSAKGALFKWASGMALVWCLLMTLWLPWTDAMKSYRAMVTELRNSMIPGTSLIAYRGVGESERAMIEYFGNTRLMRLDDPAVKRCGYLLIGGERGATPAGGDPSWRKVWEGGRPGHHKELFTLYHLGP